MLDRVSRNQILKRFLPWNENLNRKLWSSGPIVIAYHGVTEAPVDSRVNYGIHVTRASFEAQIEWLRKHYQFWSTTQLALALREGESLPNDVAVLTFDDGYANLIPNALPILERHKIPFSVYLNTHYVGTTRFLPTFLSRMVIYSEKVSRLELPSIDRIFEFTSSESREKTRWEVQNAIKKLPQSDVSAIEAELNRIVDERFSKEETERFFECGFLTWEDARKLQQTGAEIGSHCHGHTILHEAQSDEEINREIGMSFEVLEKNLNISERIFAFPNGGRNDISPRALKALKNYDVKVAFTTIHAAVRSEQSPLLLPRVDGPQDPRSLPAKLRVTREEQVAYAAWSDSALSRSKI